MWWHPVQDRVGGKDSPEVVGPEIEGLPVGVFDVGGLERFFDGCPDRRGRQGGAVANIVPLKEQGRRWFPYSLVFVVERHQRYRLRVAPDPGNDRGQYIGQLLKGTVSLINVPTRAKLALSALGLAVLTGCASETGRLIDSPLGIQEQTSQILEIVPLGTSRRDALDRLQANGVEVTPGAADSVVYCSIWNRKNGERWTMNVALLFDEQGRLYAARPAEADVSLDSAATTGNTSLPAGRSPSSRTATPKAASEAGDTLGGQSTTPAAGSSRGSRPRVPFGSP